MLKLIASCALLFTCLAQTKAQSCNIPGTAAPSGITFGHSSGGYQVFKNNTTVFTESVDYYFDATPPSVLNFSYELASTTAANPQFTGYTATLYYRTGAGVFSRTCSNNVLVSVSSQAPTTYYFSVPADGVPINTRFVVRLTLSVSNVTNADILGNNFKLDSRAIQLPVNSALPVRFTSVDVARQGSNNIISWKVAAETNVSSYELQRSFDGRSFNTINSIKAVNATEYTLADPASGNSTYYRISNIDLDGKYAWSPTVKVDGRKVSFVKQLYPMPVQSQLIVKHGALSEKTKLSLIAADGKLLQTFTIVPGVLETVLDMSNASGGLYFLRFLDNTGQSETIRFVKQ